MEIRFGRYRFSLSPDETVLEGMLRQGVPARFSCRAGSCHVCMMRTIQGQVPASASRGISPALKDLGYFLPCQCRPDQPLTIDTPDPEHRCRDALVADKTIINGKLAILQLETSPEFQPLPGQHIAVVHPDGSRRPYSIASRPAKDYFFELHVRRVDGGKVSGWLFDEVAVGDSIQIQPPTGNFVNRNPIAEQKLLLIATGTGLAPLLPILADSLERASTAQVWLFHGARQPADLYADERLRKLAAADPRFRYLPCCSQPTENNPPLAGRVTDWIAHFLPQLRGFRAFLAGHPDMVGDAAKLCIELGINPESDLITDAFEFDHTRHADNHLARQDQSGRRRPSPDLSLWQELGNGEILKAQTERMNPTVVNKSKAS